MPGRRRRAGPPRLPHRVGIVPQRPVAPDRAGAARRVPASCDAGRDGPGRDGRRRGAGDFRDGALVLLAASWPRPAAWSGCAAGPAPAATPDEPDRPRPTISPAFWSTRRALGRRPRPPRGGRPSSPPAAPPAGACRTGARGRRPSPSRRWPSRRCSSSAWRRGRGAPARTRRGGSGRRATRRRTSTAEARLTFGGIVLERRAVGVTATYPQVKVTTDGEDAAPTWCCRRSTA